MKFLDFKEWLVREIAKRTGESPEVCRKRLESQVEKSYTDNPFRHFKKERKP